MKLLYFATFRAKIGRGEETLAPPPAIANVGQLIDWLAARGPGYGAAFADRSLIRVAVNQDYVDFAHPVKSGDEIAIFPPVTGG